MDPTLENDLAALEAFVIDDNALGQLEDSLAEFNIFDSIGMVHQELRHSQLLAFLLDPRESHGLGDAFLTRFLTLALQQADDPPMSPIEIDVAELSHAEVRREWNQIDILVTDWRSKLTCVIENKVKADEHGDQLQKYRRIAERHFSGHRRLYLFLSPDGRSPSDEAYIPIGYDLVVRVLEHLVEHRAGAMGPDIQTLFKHYATMIRRHVLSDSPTAELCQKLWKRHRRALELLYEHRPDVRATLREHVAGLISKTDVAHGLVMAKPTKAYIAFRPQRWLDIGARLAEKGFAIDREPAMFEFDNNDRELTLRLYIAPVPRPIQEAIFESASSKPALFRGGKSKLGKNWTIIYQRALLRADDYESLDEDELCEKVGRGWSEFLRDDMEPLIEAVGASNWPTSPAEPTPDGS